MTSSIQLARRLYQGINFALPQRNAIIAILLLTFVMAGANAAEPLVLKFFFDELAAERNLGQLAKGLGVLAALAIIREFSHSVSDWLGWRARIGLQYALLEATIGKLHKMPLHIQRSEGVGAIMIRLDRSIQGFVGAVTQILFNTLPAVVFLGISIAIMFSLDWRLALLVLAFAPIPALIAVRAAPEQMRRERTLLDRWARIYSRFNEVLSGILIVRSFSMEEIEKNRFLRDVSEANQVVVRGVATDAGYGATSNLVIALARIAAIGLGGYLAYQGEITVGTVIAFLGYVGGLFGPVQGLSGIYQTVNRAAVSLEAIFSILDVQEHLGDSPDAVDAGDMRGDISFDTVHFGYEQEGRPLLNGVTFEASAGQTVAIVGPSGSGKTTLMSLLMRFYDPRTGTIKIDGCDLRTIKQSSLRRNMSVVLQDPLLFNDTVRANIAYGRPDATNEEIEQAARAAHAHDFIMRLPEGYDTMVGERGALLSVGERQRVTIARALLRNPRILILDEPTSALDAESEEAVQAALETLMKGRTTFIIAHRLSTVRNADLVLVMDHGRIVERGSYQELLGKGGMFTSLVKAQMLAAEA
jgi:ATP-binding cassette subfamily B protein